MGIGAWRAIVHGVAESDMTERLSTQHSSNLLVGLAYFLLYIWDLKKF